MRLARTVVAVVPTVMIALLCAAAPATAGVLPATAGNSASNTMVDKINQVRERHGLRPLSHSGSLDGSSARYARSLIRQDVLRHRNRPSAARRYRLAGEVLAMHLGRANRVGATVRSWMRSPAHRQVLLTRSMKDLGAGISYGRWGGRKAIVWVVQVGKP